MQHNIGSLVIQSEIELMKIILEGKNRFVTFILLLIGIIHKMYPSTVFVLSFLLIYLTQIYNVMIKIKVICHLFLYSCKTLRLIYQ